MIIKLLGAYCAFAITTGFLLYKNLYKPILDDITKEEGKNFCVNTKYRFLTFIVLLLFGTLLAPFLLRTAMVPPSDELVKEVRSTFIDHKLRKN